MRRELVFFIFIGLFFCGLEVFSLSRFLGSAGLFFGWLGFSLCFWRLRGTELIFPWLLFSLVFSIVSQANLLFSLSLFGLGFWFLVKFHRKMAKLKGFSQSFSGTILFLLITLIILAIGQRFGLIGFWPFIPWFSNALVASLGFHLIFSVLAQHES